MWLIDWLIDWLIVDWLIDTTISQSKTIICLISTILAIE